MSMGLAGVITIFILYLFLLPARHALPKCSIAISDNVFSKLCRNCVQNCVHCVQTVFQKMTVFYWELVRFSRLCYTKPYMKKHVNQPTRQAGKLSLGLFLSLRNLL